MKVALVHDYLNEFGGAERVLLALSEMYPEAPIYTAFVKQDSVAARKFTDKDIRVSWAQKIPGFVTKLHSPLRFLAPLIWEAFNFDDYDLVISSASWYITKGILTRPETLHICYCHTPPRYLYGYTTAVDWQKSWLVRQYARVVNKYMRQYDFLSAQRPDVMVANSREVQARIKKFYRRDSTVICPPIDLSRGTAAPRHGDTEYFLTGGRLVAAKHFDVIIQAANQLSVPLKIYGTGPLEAELKRIAGSTVEFLGHVSEQQLTELYSGATAFIALAEDEDFGMTPVEAMAAGCPVIAYRGGGYVETVIENKTGVFVDVLSADALVQAIGKLKTQNSKLKTEEIKKQASKFSKERFVQEMSQLAEEEYEKHRKVYAL